MSAPSSLEVIPDCVFHDNLKLFLNPSGRVFRFDTGTRIHYQGPSIRPQDIGQDTIATLTFDNEENRVVRIDITTYNAKMSIGMQFQQGFVVFSERMFPTDMLTQRYPNLPGLRVIASKFPAMRKINSAYSKGFWAAIGISYLEHLCSPIIPKTELDEFISRAEEVSPSDYIILDSLHDMRRARDSLGLSLLEDKHNDMSFQMHFSDLLKSLCVQYAIINPEDPIVSLLQYGVEGLESQLRYKSEIEQDIICLAAIALRVKMIVYESDGKKMAFECAQGVGKLPFVYLLHQDGAYHILYSQAKLQAQGYSVATNTRIPPLLVISTAGLQRALYHTPKPHVPLLAHEMTEKQQLAEQSITLHTSLNMHLQELILHTFETLQKRTIDSPFFDDSICTKTSELSLTFTRLFANLKENHPGLAQTTQKISILEATNFANASAKAMNLCENCDKYPGFWRFSCKHVVCKLCIQSHIEDLRKQYGFLVMPNGEPKEYFQCPVPLCKQRVKKEEIALIVGESGFKQLILEAEEATYTRHCQHCDRPREKASFFTGVYCDCKVCRICIVDLVKRRKAECLCGKKIPQSVINIVANYKMPCSGCEDSKGLLDNFTYSVCDDHLLCRDCLEVAAKEKRCSVCYRQFSDEEIGDFQMFFLKKCQLGCEREFSRAQGVKLTCKCHYCFDCAKQKATSTEFFTGCLICKEKFPEETAKQFYRLVFDILSEQKLLVATVKAANHKAPICKICFSRIGILSGVELNCSHILHKGCFREMLANFAATVITKGATCPECDIEISSHLLNTYMDTNSFSKYSTALMRIDLHLQSCPRCQFQFEYVRAINSAAKMKCPNPECQFTYCMACLAQWEDKHDARRCRFNEIQEQIRALEAEAKGDERKKVSQCPGCKIPYLKNEGCEHVKCANSQCNIDWCFECSVDRAPIIAHHNQWHRPQCRLYTKPKKKAIEPFKADCPQCKKLGALCTPPKDLKIPRRFPLEES